MREFYQAKVHHFLTLNLKVQYFPAQQKNSLHSGAIKNGVRSNK